MGKRVALARALVHDPDVLLLDEPYTGLDRSSLDRIEAVLEDLDDRTVLAATHDLERGVRLADRILFMNDGQLIEDASADQFSSVEAALNRYERLCRGQVTRAEAAGGGCENKNGNEE
jgi:heme exporter protein A